MKNMRESTLRGKKLGRIIIAFVEILKLYCCEDHGVATSDSITRHHSKKKLLEQYSSALIPTKNVNGILASPQNN